MQTPHGDAVISSRNFAKIFPGIELIDLDGDLVTTRGWIGDEVLDGVCLLIMKEHKKYRDVGLQRSKFFIAGMQFLTHMIESGLNAVSRWYKQLNVDDEEFIFIPHNAFKNHWALVIIDRRKSPIISIDYLDHLYKDGARDEVEKVFNIAMDWYKTRTKETNLSFQLGRIEKYFYDVIPHQKDIISCALFLIIGILFVSQNEPWPHKSKLNAQNLMMLRRKLAIRILKKSWDADSSTASLVLPIIDMTADSSTTTTATTGDGDNDVAILIDSSTSAISTTTTGAILIADPSTAVAILTDSSTSGAASAAGAGAILTDSSTSGTAGAGAGADTTTTTAAGTGAGAILIADSSTAVAARVGADTTTTTAAGAGAILIADSSTSGAARVGADTTTTTAAGTGAGAILIADSSTSGAAGADTTTAAGAGARADTITTTAAGASTGADITTTGTTTTFIVRPKQGWLLPHVKDIAVTILSIMWKEYDDKLLSAFATEVKEIVEDRSVDDKTKLTIPSKNAMFVKNSDVYIIMNYLATQYSLASINLRYFRSVFRKLTGNIFEGYSGVLYNILNNVFENQIWKLGSEDQKFADKIKDVRSYL